MSAWENAQLPNSGSRDERALCLMYTCWDTVWKQQVLYIEASSYCWCLIHDNFGVEKVG